MTIKRLATNSINRVLRHVNARVESLTFDRFEDARLRRVAATGHFEQGVFPIPSGFQSMKYRDVLEQVAKHAERFRDFDLVSADQAGFSFSNEYFTSPDAEVLYALIYRYRPSTVLEVGCGNSTKLIRQAIIDGGLDTRLISIDPEPRIPIDDLVDSSYRAPIESLDPVQLAAELRDRDMLFIDSTHTLKACGDVAFIYLQLLPLLPAGALVHIHDIFLPYEYPREWVVESRWPWNEQYLVHVLLNFGEQFEVIWAGHQLQRSLPDFGEHFPRARGRSASSLWLRKRESALTT